LPFFAGDQEINGAVYRRYGIIFSIFKPVFSVEAIDHGGERGDGSIGETVHQVYC
jgi:hypothetical protein